MSKWMQVFVDYFDEPKPEPARVLPNIPGMTCCGTCYGDKECGPDNFVRILSESEKFLLPCLGCGVTPHKAHLIRYANRARFGMKPNCDIDTRWRVGCYSCGINFAKGDEISAIAAWNKRWGITISRECLNVLVSNARNHIDSRAVGIHIMEQQDDGAPLEYIEHLKHAEEKLNEAEAALDKGEQQ